VRVLFPPRGRLVTAGAVVLVAVSASIAYAAIPDAGSQTFSACVLNGVGTVRLIDKAKSGITGRCTNLETAVSWNAKGQPGSPGLPGAAGVAGFDVPVSQGGLYVGLGEARVTALDGEVTIQCAIFGGAQRIADTFTTSGTYSTHQLMSVVNVPKLSEGGVFTSSLQCTDLGNTGRRFSVTATFELEKVGSVASFDQ
jgi:hypothetical protein